MVVSVWGGGDVEWGVGCGMVVSMWGGGDVEWGVVWW